MPPRSFAASALIDAARFLVQIEQDRHARQPHSLSASSTILRFICAFIPPLFVVDISTHTRKAARLPAIILNSFKPANHTPTALDDIRDRPAIGLVDRAGLASPSCARADDCAVTRSDLADCSSFELNARKENHSRARSITEDEDQAGPPTAEGVSVQREVNVLPDQGK